MSDLYNIPQDDGKKWRKSQFLKMMKNKYIDGATDCFHLRYYAEEQNLDNEQRFWLAYLYALAYSSYTALRTFTEFPNFENIKLSEVKAYWSENKDKLWFNPDRKYVKNNDKFVDCIKSFRKNMSSKPYDVFINKFEGKPDLLYKDICSNWVYFGPHSAFLMFDALYELFPNIDVSKMDWNHRGKTVVEGMAHFMYEDELIKSKGYDLDKYDKVLAKIQEKTGKPIIHIESTLCAYRKLFKGTRYVGYYADRNLEECYFAKEQGWADKLHLFEYRKKEIPERMRGEDNNWKGIRKNLCETWVKTGNLEPTID